MACGCRRFWFHTSLVGFHPLTPEMLATLGELFVERTIASAKQRIDDYMRRRALHVRVEGPECIMVMDQL